jgi:hypothetical protein
MSRSPQQGAEARGFFGSVFCFSGSTMPFAIH